MKILITAFEAFGGDSLNSSEETLKHLQSCINNTEIVKLIIPTVRYKSLELIIEKIKEEKPDVLISLGQAGGRFAVTPELVAINYDDYSIPDNEGNQPKGEAISPHGLPAYFSTLPFKSIIQNLKENKLPAELSTSAGTFICNHIFYGVSEFIAQNAPHIKYDFIHLPVLTEQAINYRKLPSLSLAQLVRALEIIIETCSNSNKNNN